MKPCSSLLFLAVFTCALQVQGCDPLQRHTLSSSVEGKGMPSPLHCLVAMLTFGSMALDLQSELLCLHPTSFANPVSLSGFHCHCREEEREDPNTTCKSHQLVNELEPKSLVSARPCFPRLYLSVPRTGHRGCERRGY